MTEVIIDGREGSGHSYGTMRSVAEEVLGRECPCDRLTSCRKAQDVLPRHCGKVGWGNVQLPLGPPSWRV